MNTGERDLLLRLYEERGKKSEISGKPLYTPEHPNFHWQQSHILPKSIYGLYRLNPENVFLCLPNEHLFYEHFVSSDRQKMMYKQYAEKWEALFKRKEELKQLYHQKKSSL